MASIFFHEKSEKNLFKIRIKKKIWVIFTFFLFSLVWNLYTSDSVQTDTSFVWWFKALFLYIFEKIIRFWIWLAWTWYIVLYAFNFN
jgi:hypothetical protein